MANLADLGITRPPMVPGLGAGYTSQSYDPSALGRTGISLGRQSTNAGIGSMSVDGTAGPFDGFNANQPGRQPVYGSQPAGGGFGAGGWASDPAQLDWFKNAGATPGAGNIPSYLQNIPGMMQTLGQNPSVMGHNETVADPWGTFNGLGSDMDKYSWFNNHPQYQNAIRGNMGASFAPWYSNIDSNGGAAAAGSGQFNGQPYSPPAPTGTLASLGGASPATTPTDPLAPKLPPPDPMQGSTDLSGKFSSTAGPLSSTAKSTDPNTNALFDVYGDPSYQFRLAEGNKSLGNNYSARGHFLSGAAAKGLAQYNQNMASEEYGKAFGRMTGDRQYNLDVQRGDQNQANIDRLANFTMANTDRTFNANQGNINRQFDADQALKDQTIPFNQQLSLAQLGLGGSQASSQSNAALAAIMSGNITGAGNAGAAGTVGSSNSFSSAISQMIGNYLQQNMLNQIFPKS